MKNVKIEKISRQKCSHLIRAAEQEDSTMARTGSNIYKRKDGRYEGRILVGKNCRRKPKFIYVYARTLKEVRQKMDAARSSAPMERKTEAAVFMRDMAEGWLKEKKETWKPTTFRMYQIVVRNYIIPLLGDCRMVDIDREAMESFAETLDSRSKREKLSGRYKKYICSLAGQIMVYAGCVRPALPEFRAEQKAVQLPPEQDLENLKQYLLAHLSEDTCVGILVAMHTGIRIGELCALRWEDFDLDKGCLTIRRNLQRVRRDAPPAGGPKTQVCIQMPKTLSSVRVIPLSDGLIDLLRLCRKPAGGYLISGRKSAWAEVRTLQYRFSSILKKCRVSRFRFHMLRHAFASRCVELGCDVKSLSEVLGHSSIQVTMNIYVHSSMRQKKNMMNLVCGQLI